MRKGKQGSDPEGEPGETQAPASNRPCPAYSGELQGNAFWPHVLDPWNPGSSAQLGQQMVYPRI